MNTLQWIQLVSSLTAQLLSNISPEAHTPAMIDKAHGTAQAIVAKTTASAPNANPAVEAKPVAEVPAPAPIAAPVIDYDKLAAAIVAVQSAKETPTT